LIQVYGCKAMNGVKKYEMT